MGGQRRQVGVGEGNHRGSLLLGGRRQPDGVVLVPAVVERDQDVTAARVEHRAHPVGARGGDHLHPGAQDPQMRGQVPVSYTHLYADADLPPDGSLTEQDPRSGRLVADDEGAHPDTEPDLVAHDVGIDGGAATAEEAAVHVQDDTEDQEDVYKRQ